MINLILDQNSNDALTLPDGKMKAFAEQVIAEHAEKGDVTYTIGNENTLLYFRVAVREKRLPHTALNITCEGEPFVMDDTGKFRVWPKTMNNDWDEAMGFLL